MTQRHEHSDHPHFKCVLEARLRDDVPDDTWATAPEDPNPPPPMPVELRRGVEHHALIYTDGFVAVTLFECCYALWSVATGRVDGGSLWHRGAHVLTPESHKLLRRHAEGALSVRATSLGGRVVAAREALARIHLSRPADHERARVHLAQLEHAWGHARLDAAEAEKDAALAGAGPYMDLEKDLSAAAEHLEPNEDDLAAADEFPLPSEETKKAAIEFAGRVVRAAFAIDPERPLIPRFGAGAAVDLYWQSDRGRLLVNVPADPTGMVTFYGDTPDGGSIKGSLRRENPIGFLARWLVDVEFRHSPRAPSTSGGVR